MASEVTPKMYKAGMKASRNWRGTYQERSKVSTIYLAMKKAESENTVSVDREDLATIIASAGSGDIDSPVFAAIIRIENILNAREPK